MTAHSPTPTGPPPVPPEGPAPRRSPRLLAWGLAALLLGATAALYAHPDLVFDIATRLWTCL